MFRLKDQEVNLIIFIRLTHGTTRGPAQKDFSDQDPRFDFGASAALHFARPLF